MSKTLLLIHVVFCTKHRLNVLNPDKAKELYNIIYGICRKNKCWVHRINGIPNHIHLLFDLNPGIALADLIKMIKINTNTWLSNNPAFPNFTNWGKGYFAVSVSPEDKEKVRQYIINQQSHHSRENFITEIERIIELNGMEWYPDDWD